MSREELIKNLREIANTGSISSQNRDICAEAADVIEELSKQVTTWHDAPSDPPPEYVSVIGHIPSQAPFPTSRECFVTPKGTWFCQALDEEYEVTQWTEMPKYKGRDDEYTPQFDITKMANEEYITKSEAIEAACNAVELFPSEYHEIENAINRIAADEDTGLEPEKIVLLKNIVDDAFSDKPGFTEHIRELLRAEKDGRLVVLPCKVGDTIYRCGDPIKKIYEWQIAYVEVYEDETVFVDDSDNTFVEADIGKTVFLTHEEAEKVLEEV